MTIKCLIIDDEPLAIQIIREYLTQVSDLELVATFENSLEAFEWVSKNPIDLIFLDIQMPLLTGIDFVKTLPQPPKVIFTTAHRNYAIESYELDVVDYLLKPISFIRFFKAVNKFKSLSDIPVATTQITQPELVHNHLYVNANKKFIKILFEQIRYIESIKDYIHIHTTDQNVITKEKISSFAAKLPHNFMRIHRSFIVNIARITAFTATHVEIEGQELPIGYSYKNEVIARLKA
ncbi:MAG TPA: DNA-binding response regulator [Microscillaceae bacterium]|nr:DNA-binding response regulator [Microscillaceae bacterium]